MTTGQTWQFKQYKWSDPRDLFRNVKGVYMGWNNEPLNSNIKDWNVSTFGVSVKVHIYIYIYIYIYSSDKYIGR